MSQAIHTEEGHEHGHNPHLAHHFDTPAQQFDSGKLGMWLFLNTEVLLFGGLFCAYSVYRAIHPEIFVYAHQFLDKRLGAINTAVLIVSSLTMAWAVRCAQLNNRKGLIVNLIVTLLCACTFLGIKGIEYNNKWREGLLWGQHYYDGQEREKYLEQHPEAKAGPPGQTVSNQGAKQGASMGGMNAPDTGGGVGNGGSASGAAGVTPGMAAGTPPSNPPGTAGTPGGAQVTYTPDGYIEEKSVIAPAAVGPQGVSAAYKTNQFHKAKVEEGSEPEPANVQLFFGIYFIMTGLHGVHVILGMVVITWMLIRSIRGEFSSEYYNPIDFTALYWHIVDLVWIFLFPLLYLIGNAG